jgi:CelD/BcsL family acetyltransferase involved in cellulose biosynthesis
MIDAAASFQGSDGKTGLDPCEQGSGRIEVLPADSTALALYAELCAGGIFAPAQSALWVRNWTAHAKPDGLIAAIIVNGRAVFALALEIVNSGPFRVARFMGGSHANGNFPATLRSWLASETSVAVNAVIRAIHAARPDIDAILLQRVATNLDSVENPLLALRHAPSPNLALAVKLDGGFEAVLERAPAKRLAKRHRKQQRKFEAAGGFRRITARSPQDAIGMFDAFLAMKAERFRELGVANVFDGPHIRAFFQALFVGALNETRPSFVLHGLEVDGRLRAITGTSICGKRLICEFGAISSANLPGSSPGEFLFFDNIREACETEYQIYDFSVGDEPYKRSWCDIETRHVDILLPLTAKGRVLTATTRLAAWLKAFVKGNPLIWRLVKTVRRRTARTAMRDE